MTGLKHMTELALGQLKDVLDAYAERDADKALAVWRHDERRSTRCTTRCSASC